jgi:plastocyanin domain-containing protein
MREIVFVCSLALLAACGSGSAPPPDDGHPRLAVSVDGSGYHPAELSAAPGQLVHVVFTRTSDEGCGQQVVFPDLGIHRDLPLGEPISVDVTMPATGRVSFTCGMSMYRGAIVAR